MEPKTKANTILFSGTEYDASVLVAQASTYPQATMLRNEIVANPDGIYFDKKLRYVVVAQRNSINYIIASPCALDQLPADALICYLATKYAIKRAIKGRTIEVSAEEQRGYRGNRSFDNTRNYSRRDSSYSRSNNNSSRQAFQREGWDD